MGLFESNAKWKILTFFFENAGSRQYVKGLARRLKISSGSASTQCKQLFKEGALRQERQGNSLFYSLDRQNPFVKRLRTAWFLKKLYEFKDAWSASEFQSVALYGSYASGEFDEKSDADFLVITSLDKKDVLQRFEQLKKLSTEPSLTVFPLHKWMELAEKHDPFYVEVLANHVLLHGASIVVS